MTVIQAKARLAEDVGLVMRDAQDLIKVSAGAASEKAGILRGHLTNAMEFAKTACGKAQDQTVQAAKATDGMIRAHPYQTIGVALGTGLLIGAFVARR
jgi:ElaB/YqjD/DUF883 family membrane-anchored ribosome-binding protein